jgi:hypothetical protein
MGNKANASRINGRNKNFAQRLRFAYFGKPGLMLLNTKRDLPRIYHNIKDEYLQNYLDEFCHKTNRRYLREQIVDRLMFR